MSYGFVDNTSDEKKKTEPEKKSEEVNAAKKRPAPQEPSN